MSAMKEIKLISSIRQLAKYAVLMACVGLIGCANDDAPEVLEIFEVPDALNGADEESESAVGVAALSWVAPSTRVDDTALPMSEIGGYKVYMGMSADELVLYQDISDPYIMELIVTDLSAGTYYFAVTAYNQYGAESGFSVIASKSI
ncbi:hypothetical protein MNBD_GAMMA17-2084 [hydrothermal vent metagenome]|uniref:Fibronectin type-III domain-containing protein n=1 Tax=hydrothermal vent metagenome TaxID=652676 RepID=A0A3B0ZQN1_9ZZZZ